PVIDFLMTQLFSFANLKTVFISRTPPLVGPNAPPGGIAGISEEDISFTESEIAALLQKLGIDQPRSVIADIYRDTGGWAFAVNLVALSLKNATVYESQARSAMRRQIFQLIDREIFSKLDEKEKNALLKLSLLVQLPVELARSVTGEESPPLERTVSFIRYDAYLDAFQIHQLFLDFLREKTDLLSAGEIRETLCAAARWCDAHGQKIDAISYYEKAGEYDAIIGIAREFALQLPVNSARFILGIFDAAPPGTLEKNVTYYVLRNRLLMSLSRLSDALAECEKYVRRFSALPPSPFTNRVLAGVYEAIAVTGFLAAPATDRYDFDAPMARANHYYRLTPYEAKGQSTKMSIGTWASRVGTTRPGAQEEFIGALTRAVPHAAGAMGGCMSGLDDLARGELFYYRADLRAARTCIEEAAAKAETGGQHDIRSRALFYLLRIAAARGDTGQIEELLPEIERQLDCEEYPTRQITYDIVTSWYHVLAGQHRHAAAWLRGDLDESEFPSFLAEFANVIRMKIYYAGERYYDLLAFLESQPARGVLFGRLEGKVLQAACLYQIKNRAGALDALEQAYGLAESNRLDMPFIEMGQDMRTLTTAALKDGSAGIPREWLEKINSKSATYAKRRLAVTAAYRLANRLGDEISLSSREKEVLTDLYHGLSRSESAAHLNLSVNTVKSLLNMIYLKLGAETTADALRTALEKDLL
ncbi:MAG: LuxR C-terminal-related transcriptional regulator, partial [Gracilibacteraceae bacterium]|nr:LuxR C-terminal-related transcriptional regulator [Gracilibacteraceae bacterium]